MTSKSVITEGMIVSSFDRKDVMERTYLVLQQARKQVYIRDNMIVQKMDGMKAEEILDLTLKQIEDAKKMAKGQINVKTKVERVE